MGWLLEHTGKRNEKEIMDSHNKLSITFYKWHLQEISQNTTVFHIVRQPWSLKRFILDEPIDQHLELLELAGCLVVPVGVVRVGLGHLKSLLILPPQELPREAQLPHINHL